MKQFSKILVRVAVVIVLFTGAAITLNTNGVKTVSEANAASMNQVYAYLVDHGYTVVTLEPKVGTKYDWIAQTIKNGVHYWTTVYCTDTAIIGNSDMPM